MEQRVLKLLRQYAGLARRSKRSYADVVTILARNWYESSAKHMETDAERDVLRARILTVIEREYALEDPKLDLSKIL